MKTKGLEKARAAISSLTPELLRILEEVAMDRVYLVDGRLRHKPAAFMVAVELLESDFRALSTLSCLGLIEHRHSEEAGVTWTITHEADQALSELFHSGRAERTTPPMDRLWL